jgi:hypothetical protein
MTQLCEEESLARVDGHLWISRKLLAIALFVTAASCGRDPEPPEQTGVPVAFEAASQDRVECPKGQPVDTVCEALVIGNVGTREGDGYCELRPRRGSDAEFLEGDRRRRLEFNDWPAGSSIEVVIAITPAEDGETPSPILYCDPGPVA